MSESPIEIDLTRGLITAAGTALALEQKKTQLFNDIKILNKAYVNSSVKSQIPDLDALSPPSKVLGLIGLRKTVFIV